MTTTSTIHTVHLRLVEFTQREKGQKVTARDIATAHLAIAAIGHLRELADRSLRTYGDALHTSVDRGIQLDAEGAAPAARPVPTPRGGPIPVETTLGSPFLPPEAERATEHRDIAYGADLRQRLDLHLPPGCAGGGLPLVVWIAVTSARPGRAATTRSLARPSTSISVMPRTGAEWTSARRITV